MTSLTEMAAFVAVIEQGGFSKAGRGLRVSTAVVSNRVARLEERLGIRLLNRTTRKVALTEEALSYFEDCKRILGEVEAAEGKLTAGADRPQGVIRISAPVTFGRQHLAPLLPGFSRRFKGIELRLHLSDRMADLVAENIDLAIRLANLPDSALVARKIASCPRVLAAAPDYLRRKGRPQKPEDLLAHDCLLLRFPGSTQFQWSFLEGGGKSQTIAVKGRMDSDNGDALTEWALAGEGIILKPRFEIREEIADGKLEVVMEKYPPPAVTLSALWPQGPFVNPRTRLLVDYLMEALKDWPAPQEIRD
ncbi:MAG: LysR family transcriptional regulator [Alphaproteobacteria bacterium]|nr:MAG: LysR family transcriptional regulator [Alphaproteobacteria bacterium]